MDETTSYDLTVSEIDGAAGIVRGTVFNHSAQDWHRGEGIGELVIGLRLLRPGATTAVVEGRERLPPCIPAGASSPFEIRFDRTFLGHGQFKLVLGLLYEGLRWIPQDHGTPYQSDFVVVPPPAQAATAPAQVFAAAPEHPYRGRPAWSFWAKGVARHAGQPIDPVIAPPFKIGRAQTIATAGSCFAQNIALHLQRTGFNFLCTERPPEGDAAGFSARYGNIYTAHQLRQLLLRAYGLLRPKDRAWQRPDGRFIDPFRPQIFPDGFPSEAAVEQERERHLLQVRRVFEDSDVFVFTLGLTETWINAEDGTALPVPPGVVAARAGNGPYLFRNYGVDAIVQELRAFIANIRLINPKLRLILTVSPVPLVATWENRHVLVSNTLSKSVLRSAADVIEQTEPGVAYFPSYEIVTAHPSAGTWFANDLRSVTPEGVAQVMSVFARHYLNETASPPLPEPRQLSPAPAWSPGRRRLAEVVCDELLLDSGAV